MGKTVRPPRPTMSGCPLEARPGVTLEGRFLLVEVIGRGGMATVWKARDLEGEGRLLAIKVPHPGYSSGVGAWSMFQREAEIGAALSHPWIARFVALPPRRGPSLVVMEYVPGETLAARVGRGRQLPEREALLLVSHLCDAVDHLHRRGFVHYDLKPANVMVTGDGTLRLIDFGLAHAVVASRFGWHAPAPPLASSEYAAPSRCAGSAARPAWTSTRSAPCSTRC